MVLVLILLGFFIGALCLTLYKEKKFEGKDEIKFFVMIIIVLIVGAILGYAKGENEGRSKGSYDRCEKIRYELGDKFPSDQYDKIKEEIRHICSF